MIVRLLSCLAVTAGLSLAPAQSAPATRSQALPGTETREPPVGGDAAEAAVKTVRERDAARQRQWDKKMRALSGSICTGC